MIQVISVGSGADFDMLAFSPPSQSTVDFMRSTLVAPTEQFTAASRSFYNNALSMFEHYAGDTAMQRIRAAARKVQHMFMPNDIRPYTTLGQLQQAQEKMRRFIMACPEVRVMHNRQLIDGYGEYYQDMQPGVVGEDHYDYRHVMDGVVVEDDQGYDKINWYYDELLEGDEILPFDSKVDIIDTWDVVRGMLKFGDEDPTSPFAAKL